MKTMKFLSLSTLAFMSAMTILSSCGKASEPKNQAEDKDHDEPSKIEVTLQEGTLPEGTDTAKDIWAKDFKATASDKQVFTAEYSEEGKATIGNPVSLKSGVWYQMKITLFNEAGKNLNSEFFDPQEMSMHQFFFIPFGPKSDKNPDKTLIDYKYGDINTQTNQYTTTPLGFTGYIKVLNSEVTPIQVQILLPHVAPPASKLDKNGNPYPFNSPNDNILDDIDMNVKMPINVIQ